MGGKAAKIGHLAGTDGIEAGGAGQFCEVGLLLTDEKL
jgi:hypothetical protein